jgi:TolB protein
MAVACRSSEVTGPSTSIIDQGTVVATESAVDILTLSGRIAFVRNGQIYVMNASGGATTRLTNSTNPNKSPVWSPDGSKIAFERDHIVGGDLLGRAIFVMNANGSGVHRLTPDSAFAGDPAWSPDGSRIAFSRGDIYVMKSDGSGVTRLANNLPFQGCGGPSRSGSGGGYSPTWSPDGREIAFLHKSTCFSNDIYVMNGNGTGVRRLTSGHLARKLAWGRTGTIAFDGRVWVGEGLSDGEIAVVRVSDAVVTRLTKNTAWDLFPGWSPDGTKITFASDRYTTPLSGLQIYVMNANGTGASRLTRNAASDDQPAWGP